MEREKDEYPRRYIAAENAIRRGKYLKSDELKASKIGNNEKGKLHRSLNEAIKFGIVINQKRILDRIFDNKRTIKDILTMFIK